MCLDFDTTDQLFQSTIVDTGNGIMTVQFKGVYFFSYSATTWESYPSTVVQMTKNGQVVAASFFNSDQHAKYSMDLKATLLLEAGDQVTAHSYQLGADGSLNFTRHGTFNYDNFSLNLDKTRGNFYGFILSTLQ